MKPLAGRTVLVTRPHPEAEALARLLELRGATAIVAPAIELVPVRSAALTRALAELEDTLRSDIHREQDELNSALKGRKAELEEQRTNRTTQLVEQQQGAEAEMTALGSKAAEAPILFGDEVIVSEGDKADKAALARLKKSASAEIERVNTEIQEQEAAEEATEEEPPPPPPAEPKRTKGE